MHKIFINNKLCSEHQKHFKDMLNEWCSYVESYTDYYEDDAVYWYNERASVSSLAVAAGRKNFFVLEEYAAIKKGYDGEGNDKEKNGRIDLFLSKDDLIYIMEAKQVWLSISEISQDVKQKITSSLKEARNDAVKSKAGNRVQSAYGLVFAVPHIASTYVKDKEILIKDFIESISDIDYDAMAYVFPSNAKTITSTGRLYPGVACLLRAPKRSA